MGDDTFYKDKSISGDKFTFLSDLIKYCHCYAFFTRAAILTVHGLVPDCLWSTKQYVFGPHLCKTRHCYVLVPPHWCQLQL